MKRFLKFLVGLVLILVALLLAAALIFPGTVVKTSVVRVGSRVIGVPITLEDADVSLFRGSAQLDSLVIGNPEGFKSEYAFRLGNLTFDMVPRSIFQDRIHIEEVVIDGPIIQYEVSLSGTNLGKLLKQVQGSQPEAKAKPAAGAEPKTAKAGKPVIIDRLVIRNAQLKLAASLTGGKSAVLPLPAIELTDIGKEQGGASWATVIDEVLTAVAATAKTVVMGAGDLLGGGAKIAGDGIKVAGEAADAGAKALGQAAEKGAESLKKGAGEAAGIAEDGARQVVKGLSGLLGGKKQGAETNAAKETP